MRAREISRSWLKYRRLKIGPSDVLKMPKYKNKKKTNYEAISKKWLTHLIFDIMNLFKTELHAPVVK